MIPDNGGFATAAYIAAAVIYVGYALSVRARTRRLLARRREMPEQSGGPR
ncbi:hypothetical protein BH11GEM2_BH11GEM2_22530 [soil metagenome]|jgi:hypothetical protein